MRKSVSIPEDVEQYIREWRAKCILNGQEKSFSQCVTEMLREIVRQSKTKNEKTIYIIYYDDNYGPHSTGQLIIHRIFESEQKAEEHKQEALWQFYKKYPRLHNKKPYWIQEYSLEA